MNAMTIEEHTIALAIILVLTLTTIIIKQNYLFNKDKKRKLFFASLVTIIVVTSDLFMLSFEIRKIANSALGNTFAVLNYTLSPLIIAILGDTFANKKDKKRTLFLLPILINAILSILSPFFGFIFTSSPTDIHSHGKLYFVFVIACLFGGFYLLLNVLIVSRRYNDISRYTLILLSGLLLIGFVIEMINPLTHISWITATFTIIFIYAYFCELDEKIDAITGLFNRRAYEYKLSRVKLNSSYSVLIMDIDYFKQANDKYGHLYGDECLKEIGNIIFSCFSSIGFCYRIGGDEFSCISKFASNGEIEKAISKFNGKIAKCRSFDSRIPMVSIGYSKCKETDESVFDAIARADKQMYFYKDKRKSNTLK